MIRLWFVITCLIITSQFALADDKHDAEDLLKRKLDSVFTVLQKQGVDQQMKNDEIIEIVTPMFDFELMAKLSLGRKYWPQLPQEKKERFTELFINRLRSSYLDNLASYTDEKVNFEPPLKVKSKVHIPTYLISKNRKTSMLYKLYKSKADWKIYDVEIQGVSIIRSYRSQFDATMQRGGIDDLLRKMEMSADS